MNNIESRIEKLENQPEGNMRTLAMEKVNNMKPEQRAERFEIG